jgi:hypothetical protein
MGSCCSSNGASSPVLTIEPKRDTNDTNHTNGNGNGVAVNGSVSNAGGGHSTNNNTTHATEVPSPKGSRAAAAADSNVNVTVTPAAGAAGGTASGSGQNYIAGTGSMRNKDRKSGVLGVNNNNDGTGSVSSPKQKEHRSILKGDASGMPSPRREQLLNQNRAAHHRQPSHEHKVVFLSICLFSGPFSYHALVCICVCLWY